jgi:hypothetical protein
VKGKCSVLSKHQPEELGGVFWIRQSQGGSIRRNYPGSIGEILQAHARRKFFDIREDYPKACKEILDLMDDLFELEHKARDWEHLKNCWANKIPKHGGQNLCVAYEESG